MVGNEGADVMLDGSSVRSFHARAAATGNARSPTTESLVRGTISSVVAADRSRRRESTSATRCSSFERYDGTKPCRHRYDMWARPNKRDALWERQPMKVAEQLRNLWSYFRPEHTSRAAAFSTTEVCRLGDPAGVQSGQDHRYTINNKGTKMVPNCPIYAPHIILSR